MAEVGRRLLVGAPPGPVGEAALHRLQQTGAMGLLLFRSQVMPLEELPQRLLRLREKLGRPLVVAIDHEGGQVVRHLAGSTVWPGNYALGQVGQRDVTQAERWAEQMGEQMGWELRALGIGWNLAPVVDVMGTQPNPGLGWRSFGREPELVARLGVALWRGMQRAGVAGCAKHFPGLGAAVIDPHDRLPQVALSLTEWECHWQPFRTLIQAGIPAVMTTHLQAPALDPEAITTFSRRLIHTYLRQGLGFTGVCVSDDLGMGALQLQGSLPERVRQALQAGHDVAIVGQASEAQIAHVMEVLTAAEQRGELPEQEMALARIDQLVARTDVVQVLTSVHPEPATALAMAIAQAAVQVVRDPQGWLPVSDPICLYMPDVGLLAEGVLFEPCWFDPGQMAQLLRLPDAQVVMTSLADSTPLPACSSTTTHVLLLYHAQRYPGQRQVLQAVTALRQRVVVVLVGSPGDAALVPPQVTLVDAGGFRTSQLQVVGQRLQEQG
ncbi:MAG: glycoside hydrolase family 3 N-terminal domain-containing protein [Gloeomargarita sp. GMQP_bins_14]